MCQNFIWEILEVNKEVQNTRKEVRSLIQQTTANGLRHARGPIQSQDCYIDGGQKAALLTPKQKKHCRLLLESFYIQYHNLETRIKQVLFSGKVIIRL